MVKRRVLMLSSALGERSQGAAASANLPSFTVSMTTLLACAPK